MEKGVPLRAVGRAIAVMQAINRRGSLTLMEVAQAAEVPNTTARRIVETLALSGLLICDERTKRYRPTPLVHSLSCGFQFEDMLVVEARPHIEALTRAILWPVALTTRVGENMILRDSTHDLSSLTFSRYFPGYSLPLLESAAGRAYLAFSSQDHRDSIVQGLKAVPEQRAPGLHLIPALESGEMVHDILSQGFASKSRNPHTLNPGKTSSIAAPIFDRDAVVGCLSIVFFSGVMTVDKAAEAFLPQLIDAAGLISAQITRNPRAGSAAEPVRAWPRETLVDRRAHPIEQRRTA